MAENFQTNRGGLSKIAMKILMVIDAWYPHVGGGQVHVWELSKKLVDFDNEVTIYTRDLGEWNDYYPKIKVIRVGHFKKFANVIGRLEFLILAQIYALFSNYDILHLHAFSPGLIAPLVKIFRKRKIIFTMHGEGMKISGLGFGSKLLEDLVFYKIPYDLEISVAKQTLKKKSAAKKVVIIPNGVNIEQFKSAQRKRYKVKEIIYFGRLFYDKGIDLLISAFTRLDIKGLKLTIVGEGPELENLKKQTGENIEFKGKLEGEKLNLALKKADLFVMPSRLEGMPIRLLESWAAKLPVVVTDVGDNHLFISEGKNGFIADVNEESLVREIKKAMSSNLVGIADNAFLEVQSYSWHKIANWTNEEYQKLYGS